MQRLVTVDRVCPTNENDDGRGLGGSRRCRQCAREAESIGGNPDLPIPRVRDDDTPDGDRRNVVADDFQVLRGDVDT